MSIFNPLFERLSLGADYSRVKNLEAEILAVLRKQPPGFNVQIPLKDETGPLPHHVTIAIKRLLENHPELQVLSFGSSVTICRRANLHAQIGPEALAHLHAKGLAYTKEDMPNLEHFADLSTPKVEQEET